MPARVDNPTWWQAKQEARQHPYSPALGRAHSPENGFYDEPVAVRPEDGHTQRGVWRLAWRAGRTTGTSGSGPASAASPTPGQRAARRGALQRPADGSYFLWVALAVLQAEPYHVGHGSSQAVDDRLVRSGREQHVDGAENLEPGGVGEQRNALARLPRPLPPLLLSLRGEQHVQDSRPPAQCPARQHEGERGNPPDRVDVVEQETHHACVVGADGRAQRAGPRDGPLVLRPRAQQALSGRGVTVCGGER